MEQIVAIAQRITASGSTLLATKASPQIYEAIRAIVPEAQFHSQARMIVAQKEPPPQKGDVLILSAGTADIPIAQEAAVTARVHGSKVSSLFDVGVAGIHRLLSHQRLLDQARVIVVVAGMEGALASVVGGLVNKPVIAVPTSIGYGAHFGGVAALLTMLNSCVGGVAVVNIDNGYSAGCIAHLINTIDTADIINTINTINTTNTPNILGKSDLNTSEMNKPESESSGQEGEEKSH